MTPDAAAAASASFLHARIGRFVVTGMLGAGGMGIVLEAIDPALDRRVAIKLLLTGAGGPAGDAEARLAREAQAMAKLGHPNVVTVHEVGKVEDQLFLAMELVEGGTLRAWLAKRRRSWREIVTMFIGAGRGLAAAHAAGLVHRDFKPENVLISADGRPRVTDFGLVVGHAAGDGTPGGWTAGTPAYMSPQQWRDESVDARSDQFSFCVALWEAVFGAPPFPGNEPGEVRDAVLAGNLARPPAVRAPRWLEACLRRGLAGDPDARWPALADLLDDLDRRSAARRLRTVAAAAGGGALVAAAAAAFFAFGLPRGPSCELAAEHVATAWNPVARARVEAAFAASHRPHAPATLSRVVAELDRRAAALGRARIAACEATHVRGEQSAGALDRRMGCFDRRVTELGAVTELLARGGDEVVVDNAVQAVAALPPADQCDATTAAAPPAIAARVAEVRARLSAASALHDAAKIDDAWRAIEPVVAAARELGYPPLLAEALLLRADVIADKEDVGGGERAYQDAAIAAAAVGDDRRAALAVIRQAELLTAGAGDARAALQRLGPIEVAAVRAGDKAVAEDLHIVRGEVYFRLARYEEARADLEAAQQAVEARTGADSLASAHVKARLSAVLWEMGRNAEALALDRRALEISVAALGPDHPMVAQLLHNLGGCLLRVGAYEEARAALERALSIKERTYGADHPSVAFPLNGLAVVAMNQGRLPDATGYFERALAIRERALSPTHPLLAGSLSNLADARRAAGRFDEALALHQRALAIREQVNGPEHPSVAQTLAGMSALLLDMGRREEALVAARRALAIRERALGADHVDVASSLEDTGNVLAAMKRDREACPTYRRAVGIVEKAQGREGPALCSILTGQARCELSAGQPTTAVGLAERAVTIGERAGKDRQIVAQAEFVLARALVRSSGDRARAIGLARAAHAVLAASPNPVRREEAAQIDRWLSEPRR